MKISSFLFLLPVVLAAPVTIGDGTNSGATPVAPATPVVPATPPIISDITVRSGGEETYNYGQCFPRDFTYLTFTTVSKLAICIHYTKEHCSGDSISMIYPELAQVFDVISPYFKSMSCQPLDDDNVPN